MDSIMEALSRLQELSNEELGQLEESALSEFETTRQGELTSDSVATMTRLADAVEAVRTEKARRVTESEAFAEQAAEAAARISPETASQTPADAPDDEEPEGTTPDESAPEVPVDDNDENPDDEPADTKKSEAFSAPSDKDDEDKDDKDGKDDDDDEEDGKPFSASEESDKTAEAAAEQPAEAEASEAPAEEPATPTQNDVQEDTVTADAAPQGADSLAIEAPAGRQPQIKPATTLSITAGADVPGYSAGAKLSSSMDVADAFQKRLHSLRHVNGGDGEQHIVASYRQEFPSDRFLSANDPMENTDKIQGVTSPEAIIAAAGVCLPLETRYDLGCDVGVTDRPVRDALARFGSDRGGVRFFSAPVLTDSAAATGFWRSEDGSNFHTYGPDRVTATTPADAKPCLEVQCTAEQEAYIEAVTLCLTFNNLTTRTFPELIKRHNELALVAHSRIAENALLAQISAGSTQLSMPTQVIGAARELFNTLGLAVAAYRHKHRMDTVAPLRMLVPAWVRDFVKADLAMQMPGDGLDDTLGVADAKIDAWFRSRGVNVTWHLDGIGPALSEITPDDAGTTGVDESRDGFTWPAEIEFALFAEGTWLYLDGGTLDLGVVRDSSLVATNQYKQFVETFEGVANVGCDSYWLSAPLKATGQAAALVDTLA